MKDVLSSGKEEKRYTVVLLFALVSLDNTFSRAVVFKKVHQPELKWQGKREMTRLSQQTLLEVFCCAINLLIYFSTTNRSLKYREPSNKKKYNLS